MRKRKTPALSLVSSPLTTTTGMSPMAAFKKEVADALAKKEVDKAAGIEKLKGLGLTADEAAAVSSK